MAPVTISVPIKWPVQGEAFADSSESFEDVRARAEQLVQVLEQRSENQIVVTSHSTFSKFLTAYVVFKELLTAELFLKGMFEHTRLRNTGITHLTIADGDHWCLETWNDDAHLGELE